MDDEQTTPGQTAMTAFGPSFDFHNPDWLAWWLSSHYMFSVEDQLALAERLRGVLNTQPCRDVLDGFIQSITDGYSGDNPTYTRIQDPVAGEAEPESSASAQAWWRGALITAARRYPGLLACSLVMLLFGAYRLFAAVPHPS